MSVTVPAFFILVAVSCDCRTDKPQKNPGARPGLVGSQGGMAYLLVISTCLWEMSQVRSLFRPPAFLNAEWAMPFSPAFMMMSMERWPWVPSRRGFTVTLVWRIVSVNCDLRPRRSPLVSVDTLPFAIFTKPPISPAAAAFLNFFRSFPAKETKRLVSAFLSFRRGMALSPASMAERERISFGVISSEKVIEDIKITPCFWFNRLSGKFVKIFFTYIKFFLTFHLIFFGSGKGQLENKSVWV